MLPDVIVVVVVDDDCNREVDCFSNDCISNVSCYKYMVIEVVGGDYSTHMLDINFKYRCKF